MQNFRYSRKKANFLGNEYKIIEIQEWIPARNYANHKRRNILLNVSDLTLFYSPLLITYVGASQFLVLLKYQTTTKICLNKILTLSSRRRQDKFYKGMFLASSMYICIYKTQKQIFLNS